MAATSEQIITPVQGRPIMSRENIPTRDELRHARVDAAIDLAAGTAGGIACVYVGQPLDTVKVKLQTFRGLYKNAFDCFHKTLRNEGIAHGLYAGTGPALAANIAENAVLFMAYGVCQKITAKLFTHGKVDDLTVFHNASAGSAAAVFSSLVLCPTELVKCRLQAMREMKMSGKLEGKGPPATKKNFIGPFALSKQIFKEEGFRGFFKGLSSTFAREVPGYFFFFGGYEISRTWLTPPGKSKDEIGALRTILCGGIGGMSLWIAVFPADVVKSRIQVQCVGTGQTAGFFSTLFSIFRKEGIAALYRGMGPNLLRTFPATGALFLAVEMTKKTLHGLTDDPVTTETLHI